MAARLADVYGALSRAFRKAGVRWVVFGAQAGVFHGLRRFTEDVDVTVELQPGGVDALTQALRREKVVARFAYDDAFLRATHVIPLRHAPTGMDIDVVIAGSGLEQDLLAHAVRRRAGRVMVPVARLDELIVLKILAARPKDRDDVERLLAIHPELDAPSLRTRLAEVEEAVGQSDLIPAFEEAFAAAKRARKRV